jgi:hypothetical protein
VVSTLDRRPAGKVFRDDGPTPRYLVVDQFPRLGAVVHCQFHEQGCSSARVSPRPMSIQSWKECAERGGQCADARVQVFRHACVRLCVRACVRACACVEATCEFAVRACFSQCDLKSCCGHVFRGVCSKRGRRRDAFSSLRTGRAEIYGAGRAKGRGGCRASRVIAVHFFKPHNGGGGGWKDGGGAGTGGGKGKSKDGSCVQGRA